MNYPVLASGLGWKTVSFKHNQPLPSTTQMCLVCPVKNAFSKTGM